MIQYSAVTFPFADHIRLSEQIVQYFDGTLTFHDLIAPHNQARPLFPRLILIANAALTQWDIRSEYAYIYLTLYGALAALLFLLKRISEGWSKTIVLTTALLINILACSPVGSNNHFWSLMLIMTLAYFSATIALVLVSINPVSRIANLLAVVFAWIAAYSNSQGLLVFPAIVLLHQLMAAKKNLPTRQSLFWIINLVFCYITYLPGVSIQDSPPPKLFDFLAFVTVYLGTPVGTLLWFSTAIDLSATTIMSGLCGLLLLGIAATSFPRTVSELPNRPEARVFVSFAAFAIATAVVTAWGRANGEYAIASGNSSRYSIFAAFFVFGMVFYFASKFARYELKLAAWHKPALGIFLVMTTISFARAIPTYRSYHEYNDWLTDAYLPDAEPTETDVRVYPDLKYLRSTRNDFLRLGIGPYRLIPNIKAPIFSGTIVDGIALQPHTVVSQSFRTLHPVIRTISFPVITWGRTPSTYRIYWKVVGTKQNAHYTLGEGSFLASGLSDWTEVTIRMSGSAAVDDAKVSFNVEGVSIQTPIGFALFAPNANQADPALINGTPSAGGTAVGFTVGYKR